MNNKTLMYIQADMHRAINGGQRDLSISVLDLKELLGAVESAAAREKKERCGVVFGFVREETLSEMRSGKALYLSIRRKKNEEYNTPVYCDPLQKSIDATTQTAQDTPLQSDD